MTYLFDLVITYLQRNVFNMFTLRLVFFLFDYFQYKYMAASPFFKP